MNNIRNFIKDIGLRFNHAELLNFNKQSAASLFCNLQFSDFYFVECTRAPVASTVNTIMTFVIAPWEGWGVLPYMSHIGRDVRPERV